MGAALGALSGFWFYTGELRPEKALAGWLVIGGSVALARTVVLYAYDEAPSPQKPPLIRDTSAPAVALGAFGLAAAGVGAWCWTRKARVSSLPSISVGSSQTALGWASNF